MLTKEGFHQNFRIISLGCKMGILPFKVDVENGKLDLLNSKWKKGNCWAYFSVFVLHTAYIALRLPYLIIARDSIPLMSLLWHCTLVMAFPNVVFWQYTAVFRWPGIMVTCFAVVYPYCLGVSAVAVLILYCVEKDDMKMLIYAGLPETIKYPWWFGL